LVPLGVAAKENLVISDIVTHTVEAMLLATQLGG
jgi:hypothetical protein